MANRHGQVARHGLTLQAESVFKPAIGWLSDFIRSSGGRPGEWISMSLSRGGVSTPRWLSDVPERRRIISREKHKGYSRYPGRRRINLHETLDYNLNGFSTSFSVDASIGHVYRASHQGLDQGAQRGQMYIRVRAWSTSGNLLVDDNRSSSGQWGYPHISGWSTRALYRWENLYSTGQPVGRVLVEQRIYTGDENWHDPGDRSPNRSWNPNYSIGRYYSFNYFGILRIDQKGTVDRTRVFVV